MCRLSSFKEAEPAPVTQDKLFFDLCHALLADEEAAAPRNRQSLALMQQLNAAMAERNPGRTPWVACLIVMGANGKFSADFEYKNPARWSIGPSTHAQRLAEFADLPIPGSQSDSQF
jgi:hypothetical protein